MDELREFQKVYSVTTPKELDLLKEVIYILGKRITDLEEDLEEMDYRVRSSQTDIDLLKMKGE